MLLKEKIERKKEEEEYRPFLDEFKVKIRCWNLK
jgi:hypothetical protein